MLRYIYRVTVDGEPDDELLVRDEPVPAEAEVLYRGRTVVVEEIEELHETDMSGHDLGERLAADPNTKIARTLICRRLQRPPARRAAPGESPGREQSSPRPHAQRGASPRPRQPRHGRREFRYQVPEAPEAVARSDQASFSWTSITFQQDGAASVCAAVARLVRAREHNALALEAQARAADSGARGTSRW